MTPYVSIAPAAYHQIIRAGNPHLYSILIEVGAILGLALTVWDSRRWNLPARHRWGLALAVLAGGIIGSGVPEWRAGGIIQQQAEQCTINPKTIIAGLFFGFVGAVVYKKALRLKAETSDAFARGICLTMAIGKLGCYAAHCCFGIASSSFIARDFGDGVRRLPVQLMESAALFLTFGLMCVLHERDLFHDRRLFIYFGIYGALRFGFEFLREPIAGGYAGVGFYQWLSLGLVLVGLYQVVRRAPGASAPPAMAVGETS